MGINISHKKVSDFCTLHVYFAHLSSHIWVRRFITRTGVISSLFVLMLHWCLFMSGVLSCEEPDFRARIISRLFLPWLLVCWHGFCASSGCWRTRMWLTWPRAASECSNAAWRFYDLTAIPKAWYPVWQSQFVLTAFQPGMYTKTIQRGISCDFYDYRKIYSSSFTMSLFFSSKKFY